MTSKLEQLLEELGIEAEITLTDTPLPEGFDPDGNAWNVSFQRDGSEMLAVPFHTGSALGEPSGADVIECLVSDAQSLVYVTSFEEWADELGYDTDSRKAHATFEMVKAQTSKTTEAFGQDWPRMVEASEDDNR